MARNTMDFAQQNTERAVQATDWMRAIAEQNLNLSKAAFEELLTIARRSASGFYSRLHDVCRKSALKYVRRCSEACSYERATGIHSDPN
jgi:hypothetical protein